MDVQDKTLVVTGAGRGIGRALALHFARAGAQVALVDTNASDLEETARLAREDGDKLTDALTFRLAVEAGA